ncbi:MAG: allophanate hydrolase [Acidobacteria bacterium]|nr:MAG: allophanate hydrolase [Acidobacteriota bacterium]
MGDLPRIFSLGDDCATVNFGNEISLELNSKAIGLATALNGTTFPGLVEAVPAYASVSVFFDPVVVRRAGIEHESAFETVSNLIVSTFNNLEREQIQIGRVVDISVDFGNESALDLGRVAEFAGTSAADVIEIFTSKTYRVYMLGFLPGFAYMGQVDVRIAVPRRDTPRTSVPRGSVGIAGSQTGIYPFRSPGGWQIIGRTNEEMFSLNRDPNSLLQPGDVVRFVPMS